MNLSTVKWAQWDKTQSRDLLVYSYVCALHCAQLLHTILHRTALIIFPLSLQTIKLRCHTQRQWHSVSPEDTFTRSSITVAYSPYELDYSDIHVLQVVILLCELHWLSVQHRITYKTVVLMYKCLCGQAPSYLAAFCVPTSRLDQCHPRSAIT